MTDDTQNIIAELRIHRTILLELTADVAALKLGVCAAVKADGLTAGQLNTYAFHPVKKRASTCDEDFPNLSPLAS